MGLVPVVPRLMYWPAFDEPPVVLPALGKPRGKAVEHCPSERESPATFDEGISVDGLAISRNTGDRGRDWGVIPSATVDEMASTCVRHKVNRTKIVGVATPVASM